ncbi:MAG: accessory Sec system glycosyltransferase GtfB [Ruminococcus flavefaciens]|nr:accessory Sec system glycosyltransferase GtfB [Ruminococcus flavefaciens]
MLVFFDRYTDNVKKVQETLRGLGREVKIAVLQDNGFLPSGVSSPYEFFAYRNREEELTEKDLFYNFIELPEFWEVRLTGWTLGGIFDMGREKAKIYFKEPAEKRNVQRVEWHMEDGWVYKIDYYNRYGLKYASEFLDADKNVESKVFYSDKNQEIIVEQPVNHMISLLENGAVRSMFDSYAGFVEEYLKEAGYGEESILFVQDEKAFELFHLASEAGNRWTHILFANDDLWNQYLGMGGKNGGRFYAMPEKYPENHANGKALILTASDKIEGLEYLISELPDMVFHIAAHTQVSDKLHKLAELENVKVYPQVSAQDLEMLWDACDFYLDINHYREIYDAVDTAHRNNMLIVGFDHTAHHRELMADGCIFAEGESARMVQCIKEWIGNPDLIQERLKSQQQKKAEIWKGFF